MVQDSSQIVFVIMLGMVLMLLMSGFIVVMVLFHRQRQLRNRQKMERLTAEYENTVLSVEKEIREQTLVHVGQELHDNIGQILSLTKLTLRHSDPQRITEAKDLVQQAIKEVRNLSKAINLNWVKEIDLKDFIAHELDKISSLEFCRTEFHVNGEDMKLDDSKKLVLVRLIQECLNNAIKHASPTLIAIEIEASPDQSVIAIQDDGVGFDINQAANGQGLRNLETRMKTIGGRIELSSSPGKGTLIRLLLPN
jgi:two-component system NarL family sensor kinase